MNTPQPTPPYRLVVVEWFHSTLTWDTFQSMSDEEMADSLLRTLDEAGFTLTPPSDLCHNGHPFEPGIDADAPHEPGDPRWCDTCGEARRTNENAPGGAS